MPGWCPAVHLPDLSHCARLQGAGREGAGPGAADAQAQDCGGQVGGSSSRLEQASQGLSDSMRMCVQQEQQAAA